MTMDDVEEVGKEPAEPPGKPPENNEGDESSSSATAGPSPRWAHTCRGLCVCKRQKTIVVDQ